MSSIRGDARGEEEPKPLKKREREEKRRKHACMHQNLESAFGRIGTFI